MHHQFIGQEREQTPGDGEGWGSLACCSPWGRGESDMTQRLKNNRTQVTNATNCFYPSYIGVCVCAQSCLTL